ncbi:hypothetical protein SLA2020_328500 [Shorea laevis]
MWRAALLLPSAPPIINSNRSKIRLPIPSFLKPSKPRNFIAYPNSSSLPFRCSLDHGAAPAGDHQPEGQRNQGFWNKWKANSADIRAKLAKFGLAAVLAYCLFDGVIYTSFFVLAFLGYEKSTGKNPVANLKALLGIVVLMWTGNNITRPIRVAGAVALAPLMDRGLKKIQKYFNFPNTVYAFVLVASVVAASSLTIVGLLILSRWGK